MIIKGKARGGAGGLAKHLGREDTNERVELKELRGVTADTLADALYEMAALGSAARTERPLYHASINAEPGQEMTDAQWRESIDALEKKLGFEGQPRVVVEHGKKGREHVHVVWMRVDLEHMRGIPDSHNYRKHEEVARDLERRFDHTRVQGAHAERDGKPRPERTPSHDEMQQAERSGLTPKQARQWINTLWQATDSGKAFKAALESHGWILARGDRRDYVLIDPHGEVHSLAKRIEQGRAADVRARMKDVPLPTLPSVEQAKQQQRDRQAEARHDHEPRQTKESGNDVGSRPNLADEVGQGTTTPPIVATMDGGLVAQEREALALAARRAQQHQAPASAAPERPPHRPDAAPEIDERTRKFREQLDRNFGRESGRSR